MIEVVLFTMKNVSPDSGQVAVHPNRYVGYENVHGDWQIADDGTYTFRLLGSPIGPPKIADAKGDDE